jgi:hypothetical protein
MCGDPCVLEPGVNFFILMLEKLGAKTRYSCEGHPDRFYIMFEADYELAFRIAAIGFLTVNIWGHRKNTFNVEMSVRNSYGTLEDRNETLRFAATAWEKEFGKLVLPRITKKDRVDARRTVLSELPAITEVRDMSAVRTTKDLPSSP